MAVPEFDTPVVLYCIAIRIFVRIGLDILDLCDFSRNLRRGGVLVIMEPWIELMRTFFYDDIGLDTRLDCEADKDGFLGRSETGLVTGVLADEPVTPKRMLN